MSPKSGVTGRSAGVRRVESRGQCGTGAGAAAGGGSISRLPALETLARRPRAASNRSRGVKSPVSCVCLVVFRSVTSLDMPKAEVTWLLF